MISNNVTNTKILFEVWLTKVTTAVNVCLKFWWSKITYNNLFCRSGFILTFGDIILTRVTYFPGLGFHKAMFQYFPCTPFVHGGTTESHKNLEYENTRWDSKGRDIKNYFQCNTCKHNWQLGSNIYFCWKLDVISTCQANSQLMIS